MKKIIVLFAICFCCSSLVAMDKLKRSDARTSSSQGSVEERSCETPGRKRIPGSNPETFDTTKKPITMTNSAGSSKKTVKSLQDLKTQVSQRSDKSTQSGENSFSKT